MMNDEIKNKRKQILKRSNEIVSLKAKMAKDLERMADNFVTLAIKEKDLLNMQLGLDELRNK